MKIKTKKQLNLPQLIEWALENGIKNTYYVSENRHIVTFDENGFLENATLPLNAIFTVKVEEEITEDTELDLIERFIVNNKTYYTNPQKMSINTCLGAAPDDIIATHFYIENDDRELILIWRDGILLKE
ncbi:hypothetical protein EUA47_03000 [Staphylococcus saprophyticus]|uniref:hypothetical protein n=1 Tax=Staphylococcus saprophyticus TaxID=29385 RepID=UPI0010127184|nr:hypothetical protein [Staphylococcus saprophyticus]RXS23213.1 hypothetical protein EUA47_03000 [Staphylococcus saprophyticus]